MIFHEKQIKKYIKNNNKNYIIKKEKTSEKIL